MTAVTRYVVSKTPCPICGADVRVQGELTQDNDEYWHVTCGAAECQFSGGFYATFEEAAAASHKRFSPPPYDDIAAVLAWVYGREGVPNHIMEAVHAVAIWNGLHRPGKQRREITA